LFSFQCSRSIFLLLSIELYELNDCLLSGFSIFCRLFLESRNRVLILLGFLNLSRVLFGFSSCSFGVFLLLGFGNALGFCIVTLLVSYACCFNLCDLCGVQLF